MSKRSWRRKFNACGRLARDQAGTAEGRAAAAKAALIEANHLQPDPPPRRGRRESGPRRGYGRIAKERYKSYSRRARRAARTEGNGEGGHGGIPDDLW